MKKQIRAIAAVAAATMLLTGCAARQQNNASEQTSTTQTHIDASSIVDGYVGSGEAPLCLSGIKSSQ